MMSKKGYTLIELLAVIVILGILFSIGVISFSSFAEKSSETAKEAEIIQIINSAALYHQDNKRNHNYVSYRDENNVKHSCISVKSLIDAGYYKGNISFLNVNLTRDNTVIKVQEKNGIANYDLITNYTSDPDCIYLN